MIIDAHQHVWDLQRSPYPWLGPHLPEPMAQWNRTWTYEELQPHLARNHVDATVLVQSDDHDADTELMLEVAAAHPQVAGVVVYVPLEQPDRAAERLVELRRDPVVVGVRNLIHDRPDPDWVLRPDVDEGLGVLAEAGVPFDYVALLPRHLEHVPVLIERHPDLRLVIDHLSKPPIGRPRDQWEPWWGLIERAAAGPNVFAKVSGLYPGDDPAAWTPDLVRPFVERAVEVFGPERLMYGGDWPISVASGGYDRVFDGLAEVLGQVLGEADREQVWSGTARSFYGLDPGRLAAATQQG